MLDVTQLFTGRNEVVAKVIFLHLFVILFTGGGRPPPGIRHHPRARQTPPRSDTTPRARQTPPWARQTPPPPDQADPPPGSDTHPPDQADPPPPQGSRLQHAVYERPVRILLECILVNIAVTHFEAKKFIRCNRTRQ